MKTVSEYYRKFTIHVNIPENSSGPFRYFWFDASGKRHTHFSLVNAQKAINRYIIQLDNQEK